MEKVMTGKQRSICQKVNYNCSSTEKNKLFLWLTVKTWRWLKKHWPLLLNSEVFINTSCQCHNGSFTAFCHITKDDGRKLAINPVFFLWYFFGCHLIFGLLFRVSFVFVSFKLVHLMCNFLSTYLRPFPKWIINCTRNFSEPGKKKEEVDT